MTKKREFEPLPYYPWYWRAFRASRAVQRMHYVARGLYRELLDECWAKGGIPNDVEQLAEICGCPVTVMRTHWNTLERMFVSVHDGMLINERLENERTEQDKMRAAKSLAGVRSGQSRKQKGAEANRGEQPLTGVQSTRTSSSSSRAEQKQLHRVEESSSPSAALAPQGARGAGPTPVGEINFPWRDEIAARGNAPIGFTIPPKAES